MIRVGLGLDSRGGVSVGARPASSPSETDQAEMADLPRSLSVETVPARGGPSATTREQPAVDAAATPGAEGDRPSAVAAAELSDIVFYDGVCGLCDRFVSFVLPRDRRGVFHFAPLQGETARSRLAEADVRDLTSVVLIDRDGTHRKSAAIDRILRRLGGAWGVLAALLRIVPRPVRDLGYSLIARYRYAIFGKKESCRLPTAAERARFLP
jgi:predicted DCC family thiol-disulfide oxidoreductase YuxK